MKLHLEWRESARTYSYVKATDRRNYPRLKKSFQVQLAKVGLNRSFEGTTVNLSQGGACIQIDKWQAFRVKDSAEIVFLLPPEFTGQKKTIRLQGRAIITRVDQKKKSIGVKFTRNFRQFEPVFLPNAVGQG